MEASPPINREKLELAAIVGWAILALPFNLIKDEIAIRRLK